MSNCATVTLSISHTIRITIKTTYLYTIISAFFTSIVRPNFTAIAVSLSDAFEYPIKSASNISKLNPYIAAPLKSYNSTVSTSDIATLTATH